MSLEWLATKISKILNTNTAQIAFQSEPFVYLLTLLFSA